MAGHPARRGSVAVGAGRRGGPGEHHRCQAGIACDGTQKADRMTGTNANDVISGVGGKIQDAAKHDLDTIAGGGQNDIIDVREGNSGLNNHDYVDCGKGNHDRVFFDAGDQVRDKES